MHPSPGFKVQGLGFRVRSLGFRVYGLGHRGPVYRAEALHRVSMNQVI